ncbi:[NiFe]-hydrogenase assembly chaperone HybE [Sinorhizobium sp. 7-81]|uniref:[NiFe]-hydrogenase assembly chaperone HybE n=1 Tax=Sinorhizobium sp. 8-89 TaxID=3049089 RepID=UPI0024C3D65E|nr:[NiFe]-hydrogenase assembly chaperone HybE [Sinorhizobium sp. 8-89]MDK1493905.1 [NiFe]-hydrogenase assembly chaperone HybE [Sinorhizobium sp. 8-89]
MIANDRAAVDPARALGLRLERHYRQIRATAMVDVPICNAALGVAATGFRTYSGRAFGIVTTPWFMNLVVADLPDGTPAAPAAAGSTVRIGLPAGEVDFIVGELDAVARVDSCSLFSPVFEFSTMEAALEIAEEAVRALFDPGTLVPPPSPSAIVNRRDLLRGPFSRREETSE